MQHASPWPGIGSACFPTPCEMAHERCRPTSPAVLPGDRPRGNEHQERRGGRPGAGALVCPHRDRGRAGARGRDRQPGRGRPAAPWRRAVSRGTTSPPSDSARPGRWTSRRACSSIPPTSPAGSTCRSARSSRERLGKPTCSRTTPTPRPTASTGSAPGRNAESLILFTLGTGIGGGIIDHGRIVEGRHSHGGECGHIIIQMENARLCSCGKYGHLEAYASATSLVKRAHEALAHETIGAAPARHWPRTV